MSINNERPEMDASLVVPVFCSSISLHQLHDRLAKLGLAVVYVDDGSNDGSLDVLREIARRDDKVQVLAHPTNRGRSSAVLTGVAAARSQIVVTLDDDLQHDP